MNKNVIVVAGLIATLLVLSMALLPACGGGSTGGGGGIPADAFWTSFFVADPGCVTVGTAQVCGPSKVNSIEIDEGSTAEILGSCQFGDSDTATTGLLAPGYQFWCERSAGASGGTNIKVFSRQANLPMIHVYLVRASDGLPMWETYVTASGGLNGPDGTVYSDPYQHKEFQFAGYKKLTFTTTANKDYTFYNNNALQPLIAAGYDARSASFQATNPGFIGEVDVYDTLDGRALMEENIINSTWNVRNDPNATQGNNGTYDLKPPAGSFVAVGDNGAILTSADGVTWTSRNSGTPVDTILYGVTHGNGKYVAMGYRYVAATNTIYGVILTSPDGVTWTSQSSGVPTNILQGVTYGNGKFVAVGGDWNGTNYYGVTLTSTDGVTWISQTLTSIKLYSVAYGNGKFVAVGFTYSSPQTGVILTSPDGVTWTSQTFGTMGPLITLYDLEGVTYGNGKFVAVGESIDYSTSFLGTAGGAILTSVDGVTWTSQAFGAAWLLGVTYGNGKYVAVGSHGDYGVILTSPDGVSWASQSLEASMYVLGVTYGNGKFVAVGDKWNGTNYDEAVLTSADGVTWTSQISGTTGDLYGVTY